MDFKNVLLVRPKAKPFNFHKIITFDTESLRYGYGNPESPSYKEKQVLYNYDLYDGNDHYYGEKLSDFYLDVYNLMKKYQKITLIGHFIRFDLQILNVMKFIIEKKLFGLDLKNAFIDNVKFIKFRTKNKEFVIQFLDSYNYFHTSLQKLAENLGLSKVELEDYNLSWKDWNYKIRENGYDRVRTDTEILYKVFMEFYNDPDFVKGISIANTSFKTLKQNWLKRTLSLPHSLIDYALSSYRGGRTEIYKINSDPVYLRAYDINSLYPYVMKKEKYSYQFHREIGKINFDDIENNDYNYLFNIDYQYQDKPIRLPVVIKNENGKLTQMYSGTNQWLTGKEVLELYKDNVLITFHKGYEFLCDYLFSDFIDYFYEKRKKSTGLNREFYKLIMNTSYGSLGQHKGFSEILPLNSNNENLQFALFMSKENNVSKVNVNGKTYSFHNGFTTIHKDLPHYRMHNPLIASEITANARLVNFKYQKEIGFKHIFYTDTDSFFIDREWITSNELGKLKLEKSGMFMLYDVKDYSYIDDSGNAHITLKGIPKNSIKVDDQTYILNSFSTIKSQKQDGIVDVKNTLKKLKRERDKLEYINDNGMLIGMPL